MNENWKKRVGLRIDYRTELEGEQGGHEIHFRNTNHWQG